MNFHATVAHDLAIARERAEAHIRRVRDASTPNVESHEPEVVEAGPLVFLVGALYGAIVAGLVAFYLGRTW